MDFVRNYCLMTPFTTPDLSDTFPDSTAIDLQFKSFGSKVAFFGPAFTIQCYEDNSLVKDLTRQDGKGRILVIDGGGSLRKALVGDKIAATAASNGWAGFLIFGAVRDVEILAEINLGIFALGASPVRTDKKGVGLLDLVVKIGGVSIDSGYYIYADLNGVLVSKADLLTQNK